MKKFTLEQKNVIASTHPELLVSASAGSGKTTVMVERIAKLISEGAEADSILVLTFTVASANDIKERVGNDLNVGTFHKFCQDLCETYFTQIGLNPAFSILEGGAEIEIQNEILASIAEDFPNKTPLAFEKYTNIYGANALFEIIKSISTFLTWQPNPEEYLQKQNTILLAEHEIVSHFKTLGAWLSPNFEPQTDTFMWSKRLENVQKYDDLHAISREFVRLNTMKKDNPSYNFKEILNDNLKKIREQYALPYSEMLKNTAQDNALISQIVTLVREYNLRYSAAKRARNYLDFADLEVCAREILSDKATKIRVQDKYKYIFIDEFQDTNPIQEAILNQIRGEKTQIFAVGDVKQSIYGFRGTDSKIFENRLKSPSANVHFLNENFRSSGAILGFVNEVFERIIPDYDKSKFKINDCKGKVEVISISGGKPEHEATEITNRIVDLIEDGIAPNDIAILARSSTNFLTLVEALDTAGIKCATDKKMPARELLEIELLNNFLLAINDPNNELARFILMKSFIYGMSEKEIFEKQKSEKHRVFIEDLAHFSALAQTKNGYEVLTNWISYVTLIPRLLSTPDGEARVKNIYNFLNKLKNLSAANTVRQYCYCLENNLIDIEIDVALGADCVHIMTIHGAKGLEFDTVFLYNAGASFSSADKRKNIIADNNLGLCVYSFGDDFEKRMSLGRLAAVIMNTRTQIEEEKRLLYVALTRAKNRLVIVGSGKEYGEVFEPKSYFDFIRPVDFIEASEILPKYKKPEQQVLGVKPNKEIVEKYKKRFGQKYKFSSAVDLEIKTSVTALTHVEGYATLKTDISDAPKTGAEYGTKFHKAMQSGVGIDEESEKCLKVIDELTKGMQVYKEIVVFSEIENCGEKLIVQGVIDLLAVGEKGAIVVDYKTNKCGKAKLLELYSGQISMYAKVVEGALKLPTEKYLLSSKLGLIVVGGKEQSELGIVVVPNGGRKPSK